MLETIRQCRILSTMQTVVETPEYLKDAKSAGLSEDERQAIIDFRRLVPMSAMKCQEQAGHVKSGLLLKGRERAAACA
jgi:hypothetical protein